MNIERHSESHRFTFRKDQSITVANNKERYYLARAIRSFLGEDVSFQLQDNPDGTFTFNGLPEEIKISFMEFDEQKQEWNDGLFDFLSKQLPLHDQEYLAKFSTKSKIAMLRRLKPSPRFKSVIKKHASEYHNAVVSYTELRLAEATENLHNGISNHNVHHQEDDTLKRILSSAPDAIAFYPFAPVTSKTKIGRIFNNINAQSDKHELAYHTDLAIKDLVNEKSKKSAFAIGVGIGMEPMLENITKIFGDQAAQISSQLFGEFVAMAIAAGDRIPDMEKRKSLVDTLDHYFAITAVVFGKLPQELQKVVLSQSEEYSRFR